MHDAKGPCGMDSSEISASARSGQADVTWDTAGKMASRWLSPDNSSMEARVLTNGGIRLLQAVIYELALPADNPNAALSACYSFLATELTSPGSALTRLLSSTAPRVVSIAKETQARGEGWVVTETPQKNLIVLTVLMNLPIEGNALR